MYSPQLPFLTVQRTPPFSNFVFIIFLLCVFPIYIVLISVLKYEHPSGVTKFRISRHFLPIELGRMQEKPRSQCTCALCADTPLGDEAHFILRCSDDKYFKNLRDSFRKGCG